MNDTHGHLVGDALLRQLAEILRSSVRGTDVAGRYGGEEFILLLPQTPLPGAQALAERIRRTVGRTTFGLGEVQLTCTISIGVPAPNGEVPEGERLIAAADEALYEAKRLGRNRVVIAPTPGGSRADG